MASSRVFSFCLLLALIDSLALARQLKQTNGCYYGNSDTPLFCNSPPAAPSPPSPTAGSPPPSPSSPAGSPPPSPTTSPPPTPTTSPPSPAASPPPASPQNSNCFYGNSSTPLFCNNPPPPTASSPPPSPKSPDCFYGNSDTPLYCNTPPPPSKPAPIHHGQHGGGSSTVFSTGQGDYRLGSYSHAANPSLDYAPVSTADDFYAAEAVTIQGFSFEGLLPDSVDASVAQQAVVSVNVLLYEFFPTDSDTSRINANDPQQGTDLVVTRTGSPSDTPMYNLSAQVGQVEYTVSSLGPESVTIPLTITDTQIQASPNQQQSGPEAFSTFTGKKYEIYVPLKYQLQAGAHMFVVPLVSVECNPTPLVQGLCSFIWSSAPYPVTSSYGGTPFPSGVQDSQTWITGPGISPDWERIGADIIGDVFGSPVAYNAAFTVWA